MTTFQNQKEVLDKLQTLGGIISCVFSSVDSDTYAVEFGYNGCARLQIEWTAKSMIVVWDRNGTTTEARAYTPDPAFFEACREFAATATEPFDLDAPNLLILDICARGFRLAPASGCAGTYRFVDTRENSPISDIEIEQEDDGIWNLHQYIVKGSLSTETDVISVGRLRTADIPLVVGRTLDFLQYLQSKVTR